MHSLGEWKLLVQEGDVVEGRSIERLGEHYPLEGDCSFLFSSVKGAVDGAFDRLFRVTVPCAPQLSQISPPSGPVGTPVAISGTGFTGATAVKFNGTSATFTVVSDSQISTTVPSGASGRCPGCS